MTPVFRIAAALSMAMSALPIQAKTIALVVGISNYPHPADRLPGPIYDVAAVAKLLTGKMGVDATEIRTLVDAQATRDAIRTELLALMTRSAPGDTVVLYFSGHGTSGRDTNNTLADLPYGTGAFVPYDVRENKAPRWRDRLIVGRFDLAPLALIPLDQGGRTVIVLIDACYSGNAVRGTRSDALYRYMPIGTDSDTLATAAPAIEDSAAKPYPYRNVVMIAASAETEKARDLPAGGDTLSGTPQGAFTDSLLRIFEGQTKADFNGDGIVSFEELKRANLAYMGDHGISQTPQLLPSIADDASGLIFRAVPGLKATPVGRAARFNVSLGRGAESLRPALEQSGGIAFAAGRADLAVMRSGAGMRLTNAAGDVVADGLSADRAVARINAGQWLAQAEIAGRARIDVRADTVPTAKGGTFTIGIDTLKIAATASAPANMMIVDLFADGTLATLYPIVPTELAAQPARRRIIVPDGPPIQASPPAGLDRVLILAFAQPPQEMARWMRLNARFDSAEGQAFVAWLAAQAGDYAATAIDVRVVEAAR